MSRFSNQVEKSITVNIGIQPKSVLQFEGKAISTPPLYYTCSINFRLEWLMDRNDVWRTVRDDASANVALVEVDEVLQSKAVPFFGPTSVRQKHFRIVRDWPGFGARN